MALPMHERDEALPRRTISRRHEPSVRSLPTRSVWPLCTERTTASNTATPCRISARGVGNGRRLDGGGKCLQFRGQHVEAFGHLRLPDSPPAGTRRKVSIGVAQDLRESPVPYTAMR